MLTTRLSEEELKTVCFMLPVDYDTLGGEGKAGKARELIIYCQHHKLNGRLLKKVLQLRPDLEGEVAIRGKTGPLGIVPPPSVPEDAFRTGYDAFVAYQIQAQQNIQQQGRVTWLLFLVAFVLIEVVRMVLGR
jgi:hypothetical protein